MLLKEIKKVFHTELDAIYGKEEVSSFFYLLIEHYLGLERFILAVQPELIITKEEGSPLFEALSKLKLQVPIQYIIGKTHFMDLDFVVNKNVLIPRPETEELVRWVLDDFSTVKSDLKILDIGTGSGCIAVSLAKNLPNAKVYAIDVSEEALAVAKETAKLNGVEIYFINADILEVNDLDDKFDIIVSNPPYVRMLEKQEMKNNVLDNEPELALFVADDNPLIFYKKIIELAPKNLIDKGVLYFEINQYLGKETQSLLEATNFSEIELRKDFFGNDRMLKGKIC
jgi:release factor glutamine methyltransferase